jgi:signal transduction histidine kinase
MKQIFLVLFFFLTALFSIAQKSFVDSLHHALQNSKEDTTRVLLLTELGNYYAFNHFDSGIFYGRQIIELSNKLNYPNGNYLGLKCLFFSYNCQGNYPKALEVTLQCLKIGEKIRNESPDALVSATYCLGVLNREMGNLPIAITQLKTSLALYVDAGVPEPDMFPIFSQLALIYQPLGRSDSALWFARKGYELSLKPNVWSRFVCFSAAVLGSIHTEMGNYEQAKKYLFIGARESEKVNNIFFLSWNYNLIANLYRKTKVPDSCIYYARISLGLWRAHNFGNFAVSASNLLYSVFESQNKPDSTIKYMKISLAAKDSVFNQTKVKEFEKFVFDEEKRKQDILVEQEKYKDKIRMYVLLAAMAVLLLIAFILWRNNRQKQRAQKKIEEAYQELKSTQAQLVQQEKMASLGELTAGIAHEIQNPLNFVNNFSEVNKELLAEMKDEINKGNLHEVKSIADNLIDNQEKINHHGKRADAIVKGMLQHSRSSGNIKEPTDINALADEYLRLSYHGLRAKDKTFNTTIQTDFDTNIEKMNIIPQDIGRVLLNLFNNAFYSVNQKKKQVGDTYEPTISLSTQKKSDNIEIKVKDNGVGIAQKVLDKIFQPFFTTKPTGQGTGLGLSLSYDIIKVHGGEIKVETKEGEGSEFIIQLPAG